MYFGELEQLAKFATGVVFQAGFCIHTYNGHELCSYVVMHYCYFAFIF